MVEQGYPAGDKTNPGPADPTIQEFLQLVNAKRRSVGCLELKWDNQVALVALKHSRDMVSHKFFGHTNRGGEDPFERLRKAGVVFSAAAGSPLVYAFFAFHRGYGGGSAIGLANYR